jgi:hypothetical protein
MTPNNAVNGVTTTANSFNGDVISLKKSLAQVDHLHSLIVTPVMQYYRNLNKEVVTDPFLYVLFFSL